MKVYGLLILCLTASGAFAGMSATDAFNEGNAFGKTNVGTAKAQISTSTASDTTKGVPNYTSSDPASGYYMGGTGSLTAPATAGVTNCTSATTDPDPYTHGKCEGVRMLMKDPGKKDLMFPLNKTTDPLIAKRNIVAGDAETYLGSLIVSGAYSGCADKTVKDPDKYETEYCNQYLTAGPQKCQEILTVTVTVSESCVPSTWYGDYGFGGWIKIDAYCDMGRADGKLKLRFTPYDLHGACQLGYLDVPTTPFTVSDKVQLSTKIGQTCDPQTYDDYGNPYPLNCTDAYGPGNFETTTIHNWKGSCTVTNYIGYEPGYTQGCVNDVCSYTFRSVDSRWGNEYLGGTPNLQSPGIVHTETDSWDNQCPALDARLP